MCQTFQLGQMFCDCWSYDQPLQACQVKETLGTGAQKLGLWPAALGWTDPVHCTQAQTQIALPWLQSYKANYDMVVLEGVAANRAGLDNITELNAKVAAAIDTPVLMVLDGSASSSVMQLENSAVGGSNLNARGRLGVQRLGMDASSAAAAASNEGSSNLFKLQQLHRPAPLQKAARSSWETCCDLAT